MEFNALADFHPRFRSVWPSTAFGRAIVLRALFCRSVKEAFRTYWTHSQRNAKKVKQALHKYVSQDVRIIFRMLNLHKPHVFLPIATAIFLRIRNSSMVRIKSELAYRRTFWKKSMKNAQTYEEWTHAAAMFQKENPRTNYSAVYDEDLVKARLEELRIRSERGEAQDMLFFRTDLLRKPQTDGWQVPLLVQEYIEEVRYHLKTIICSKDLLLEEKLAFVQETRHVFGRTALLLSGGASLGTFHVGVVRTLIEHHLLPRVVAGASAGSIVCSFIATRTWPELQSFFIETMPTMQFTDPSDGIFTIANRIFTKGVVHDVQHLQHMLRKLTYNLTFQEAYEKTGRVLGISVSSLRRHEPPRCLNYLTSPHVVIWSAVSASCAFPGIFEAQELRTLSGHVEETWLQRNRLSKVQDLLLIRFFKTSWSLKFMHLACLMEMEVKHWCNQILELGLPMSCLAKVFAQDWEGDITIVMPATLAQLAKLIHNPTPSDLKRSASQGRRCTWEKLSMIKSN